MKYEMRGSRIKISWKPECFVRCIGAHLEKWISTYSKGEAVFPLTQIRVLVSNFMELKAFSLPFTDYVLGVYIYLAYNVLVVLSLPYV